MARSSRLEKPPKKDPFWHPRQLALATNRGEELLPHQQCHSAPTAILDRGPWKKFSPMEGEETTERETNQYHVVLFLYFWSGSV